MHKIPFFNLTFDAAETKAVQKVLESKWLTTGPVTEKFEMEFAGYLGQEVKCCALSNGTAALHLALLALDIKRNDEVILSGLSFVAALNVTNLVGAVPVLADSKSFNDWNVSAADIEAKITSKTRALIIVHYAGYPCDMKKIMALAKKHKIYLIEDAAHAIGAEYNDRKCGTFGDIACFSFFSNKNLSTGEGGMLVTKSESLLNKVKLLRSHGMTSMTIDRLNNNRIISYDVAMPGFNYRFDEIRAAIGSVQLRKLDKNNKKRQLIVEKYLSRLEKVNEIHIPWQNLPAGIKPAYHIFPVLLTDKTDKIALIRYLREKGIQTSIHYPAYNKFSCYAGIFKKDLEIANKISNRVLTLPLYPGMSVSDIDYVCDVLIKYFHNK